MSIMADTRFNSGPFKRKASDITACKRIPAYSRFQLPYFPRPPSTKQQKSLGAQAICLHIHISSHKSTTPHVKNMTHVKLHITRFSFSRQLLFHAAEAAWIKTRIFWVLYTLFSYGLKSGPNTSSCKIDTADICQLGVRCQNALD